MAAKDELGRAGEARAARHLEAQGYDVVDRNWRGLGGEIDLVATRAGEVVVVEVKTRRSEAYGHPFEAVDARKRARLWRLGVEWAVAHRDLAVGRRLRFAVIGLVGRDPDTAAIEVLDDLDMR